MLLYSYFVKKVTGLKGNLFRKRFINPIPCAQYHPYKNLRRRLVIFIFTGKAAKDYSN